MSAKSDLDRATQMIYSMAAELKQRESELAGAVQAESDALDRLADQATYIVHLEREAAAHRRLIRWLSLPYGLNLPIFHGPDKQVLADTYQDALAEDDGDPAFAWAVEQKLARPAPSPDRDLGDLPVELVQLDERGNEVRS